MTAFTARKTPEKAKKKIVCERKKSFAISESEHLTLSLRHQIKNLFCSQSVNQSVSLQHQQASSSRITLHFDCNELSQSDNH